MSNEPGVFMSKEQAGTAASSGIDLAPSLCDTCGREGGPPDGSLLEKQTFELQSRREIVYWSCLICQEKKIEMRLGRVVS